MQTARTLSPSPVKMEIEKMGEEEAAEEMKGDNILIKEDILDVKETKTELSPIEDERSDSPIDDSTAIVIRSSENDEKDTVKKEEKENECKKNPISTRRSSQHKSERVKDDDYKPLSKQGDKFFIFICRN